VSLCGQFSLFQGVATRHEGLSEKHPQSHTKKHGEKEKNFAPLCAPSWMTFIVSWGCHSDLNDSSGGMEAYSTIQRSFTMSKGQMLLF
jgi:hypothetical protein